MEGVWLSTYACLNCTSVNIMQSIWYWPNSVEGAYHCLVFQLILVWCLHAILSFQQRYDKCTLKCNYELGWWTLGSIIAIISAFKACHILCSFCTCYLFSLSCFCFPNIGTKPVLQGLKSCTTARSVWNFSFSVVFDSVFVQVHSYVITVWFLTFVEMYGDLCTSEMTLFRHTLRFLAAAD